MSLRDRLGLPTPPREPTQRLIDRVQPKPVEQPKMPAWTKGNLARDMTSVR